MKRLYWELNVEKFLKCRLSTALENHFLHRSKTIICIIHFNIFNPEEVNQQTSNEEYWD